MGLSMQSIIQSPGEGMEANQNLVLILVHEPKLYLWERQRDMSTKMLNSWPQNIQKRGKVVRPKVENKYNQRNRDPKANFFFFSLPSLVPVIAGPTLMLLFGCRTFIRWKTLSKVTLRTCRCIVMSWKCDHWSTMSDHLLTGVRFVYHLANWFGPATSGWALPGAAVATRSSPEYISLEGILAERPRKKEKRHLNCTPSKSRLHVLILLLSVFNFVRL